MSPAPAVTIVVPTYNERDNIERLSERVFAACDPATTQLLIIDDNSPDGTAVEAARVATRFPVCCVVRTNERGLATAVIRGLREARAPLAVVMDADLSHPPEKIAELVAAMRDERVQMSIGSRFVPGAKVDLYWPLHRRLNSLFGRVLARPLTPVRDMMSGFFCVRTAELRLDTLAPVGYKIALELIVRHRWRNVVEIPIVFTDRAAGKTKLTVGEQLRYLRHLKRLYSFAWFGR